MERKQLESAAARNRYLRGFLAVPFGLVLISSGLGNMEWGPFAEQWVVPVLFAVAGGTYLLTMRYYNDNYGRVTGKTGQARALVGFCVSVAVIGGGPVLAQVLDLPINGVAVPWAVAALGFYALAVGLKAYHVVIWSSVLVAGLVPFWGDPSTTDTANVGLLMVGVAAMATGFFNHRLLVRTFGPSEGPDLESSNVGA